MTQSEAAPVSVAAPEDTLYATISSFFFVLGLYLQTGRGDSPMVAGLTFVPLAAGNFVASLSSSAWWAASAVPR
jgi:hypothetical protein